MYDKLQQYENALEDFAIAIEIESQNGIYYHNRACCLRNMGLMEKAIEEF